MLSIILPAKNEGKGIGPVLSSLRQIFPEAEILVVDDGSEDDTAEVAKRHGAIVVKHPYSMGNGAAIKTGAQSATGTTLAFLDADGQHRPSDIPRLLAKLHQGYDMVVGKRDSASHANLGRRIANSIYNSMASFITGHKVGDLTSGIRVARADKFLEFLYLLPNGFSYPTTSTIAFFRAGYAVAYEPIQAEERTGKSHIRPMRDGARFLIIIFKIGTLYSPLKIFFPASALFFATGIGYYLLTFFTAGRFTNMSALMLTTAVLVFLIGLVSEQITQLIYRPSNPKHPPTQEVRHQSPPAVSSPNQD